MRYIVRKSIVNVLGKIWMPQVVCGQQIVLRQDYDVDHTRDDDGCITRESVARWLDIHAGGFRYIIDFEASIEDGDTTVEIPWQDEEHGLQFGDCMNPED